MYSLFLTQNPGFLGTIAKPFGWILSGIYEMLSVIHIENVAISIILFTIITKALMIPLTIKQQKFSKMSSIMQPELSKVQQKYKGKRDQDSMRKMQIEQQAIYQKYGANPTAGCLPLLISFPIMLAMYRVIQNVPAYVPAVKELYENVAEKVQTVDYINAIKEIATSVGVDVTKFKEYANGTLSTNHLIDVFAKFGTQHWDQLAQSLPSISGTIETLSNDIIHVNSLIGGLNIANAPGWGYPGIIIPILAVATQWIQGKLMNTNTQVDKSNPAAGAMGTMTTVMPIMSGFFCVMLPIGLGLYWVAGSLFGIVQQIFVNKYMDQVDVDQLVEKSKEKADRKRVKIKSLTGGKMEEVAKKQTRSIDTYESETTSTAKSTKDYAKVTTNKETKNSNYKRSEVSYKAGSISSNANVLKNRHHDKGEK